MCTIRLLTLGTLLLGLNGCAGSTYADPGSPEDTGGSGGESASESSLTRKPTGGELSASGGSSPSGSATEAPELLCVPGASDECACPGGTKGAQVCAKDGMSYGVCACEPKVVKETVVETVTENPEGYSGECIYVFTMPDVPTAQDLPCYPMKRLMINCKSVVSGCVAVRKDSYMSGTVGAYCC